MSNYNALCTNAISNVKRVGNCDVLCSSAPPSAAGTRWWLVLCAPILATLAAMSQESGGGSGAGESRSPTAGVAGSEAAPGQGCSSCASTLALAVVLLSMALAVGGCCTDPPRQIPDWLPDKGEFNLLARRTDLDGTWRGTGGMREVPGYIKITEAVCTGNGSTCIEWKFHESNCHEKSFGMCTCTQVSTSGSFCQEWACEDLEADQYVCHYVHRCTHTSPRRRRGHRRLAGTASEKQESAAVASASSANANGTEAHGGSAAVDAQPRRLDTECHWSKECFDSPMEMGEQQYRMIKAQKTKFQQLGGNDRMWALIARGPSLWGWFQTEALCIVPGDFEGTVEQQHWSQLQYCHGQAFFREIEEETQNCYCKEASRDNTHCSRWSCTKHKNGLFKVLFEAPMPNLKDYVEGLLTKDYQCSIDGYGLGGCQAWTGKFHSWKEADMTKCLCRDSACQGWICDEYKVLSTQVWWWYPHWWITGLVLLVGALCFSAFSFKETEMLWAGLGFLIAACVAGLLFYLIGLWGCFIITLASLACSAPVLLKPPSSKVEGVNSGWDGSLDSEGETSLSFL